MYINLLMELNGAASPVDDMTAEASLSDTVTATPPLFRFTDIIDGDTLYGLGTMHFLPENVDWYHDEIRQAFNASNNIFFEIDGSNPDLNAIRMREGFYHDNTRLEDILSDDDISELRQISAEYNINFDLLNRMKPWMATIMISVSSIRAQGLNSSLGVDNIMKQKVSNLNFDADPLNDKNIGYLDTPELALSAFYDQLEEDQILGLRKAIENLGNTEAIQKLQQAWIKGDLDYIAQTYAEQYDTSPAFTYALLNERNLAWIDSLHQLRNGQKDTAMIIVGTAHFTDIPDIEDDSLPEEMVERGYAVERYNYETGQYDLVGKPSGQELVNYLVNNGYNPDNISDELTRLNEIGQKQAPRP